MSNRHRPYFLGELIVSGKGELILNKQLPGRHCISVDFLPEETPPCQGHDKSDYLHWAVISKKHSYYLKLDWDVSSIRTIIWTVKEK